jgi:hypothetical protein
VAGRVDRKDVRSIWSDSYPTNTTLTRTLSSRFGSPPGFKESKAVGFAPLTLDVTITKIATATARSLNLINLYIHRYIEWPGHKLSATAS